MTEDWLDVVLRLEALTASVERKVDAVASARWPKVV